MHRFVSLSGENQYFTPFVKIFVCVCAVHNRREYPRCVCVCLWAEINLSSCYQLLCKPPQKLTPKCEQVFALLSRVFNGRISTNFFTRFFLNETEFLLATRKPFNESNFLKYFTSNVEICACSRFRFIFPSFVHFST